MMHAEGSETETDKYVTDDTIKELQENGRFVKISNASLRENHPHDIQITKEAPNYSVNEK